MLTTLFYFLRRKDRLRCHFVGIVRMGDYPTDVYFLFPLFGRSDRVHPHDHVERIDGYRRHPRHLYPWYTVIERA